jgi:hypothetical protein
MNLFKENILSVLMESRDFLTRQVSVDPETNSTTWEVEYKVDFLRLYKEIDEVFNILEDVQTQFKTPQSLTLLNLAKTLRNNFSRLAQLYSKLEETSATSQGGASFTPGDGAQYATPKAFSKSKGGGKYYYKLGYKNLPKHTPKSFEKKELWEDETLNELNDFQKQRLQSLDDIEVLLKDIYPLISNTKNETATLFGGNPGSYDVNSPIEITKSYLQDIKKILTK